MKKECIDSDVRIKAVSLDLWNTIMTSNPDGRISRVEWLSNKTDMNIKSIREKISEVKLFANDYMAKTGNQLTDDEVYGSLLNKLKLDPTPANIFSTKRYFDRSALENSPIINDRERRALELLSSKYPLYLVSNTLFTGGGILREILEKKQVLHYFKHTVFSDEQNVCKPNKKIFQAIEDLKTFKTETIIHVGDDLTTDAEGAKRMGWEFKYAKVGEREDLLKFAETMIY